MKKFLMLALLLLMTSCDFGTESKKEVPNVPPKDTTKVLMRKTVVVNDTNISKTHTLNISGKISLRNSSGNDSGFSSAVVCLESSKRCVKPNSTGLYSFAPLKTSSLFGARSLAQSDTTKTPEGIVPDTLSDTTVKIDSNVVYDTIIRNDTIYQIQTYHITRNVYIDSDTARNDSVIVYSNSRILYEIPVTSWKSILPNTWCAVKQFGVEGPIKFNEYSSEISSVEIIYWNDEDSIALNIGAGLYENKQAYSGTVFLVLDSNYQKSNDYVVVRLKDTANKVFAVTKEFKFNKMFNDVDFGKAGDTLIPGGLIVAPTLQWQASIKVGEKVNKLYVGNSGWYNLDSLYIRPMIEKIIDNDTLGNVYRVEYRIDSSKIKSLGVDSISFRFIGDTADSVQFKFAGDVRDYAAGEKRSLDIVVGKNQFNFPYTFSNINKQERISRQLVWLKTLKISDLKIFVHFKQ